MKTNISNSTIENYRITDSSLHATSSSHGWTPVTYPLSFNIKSGVEVQSIKVTHLAFQKTPYSGVTAGYMYTHNSSDRAIIKLEINKI